MLARTVLLSLCLTTALYAGGVTGRGGFEAVAVSPDGKQLAVGGQNRVVYLLDADTLQVKNRLWIEARVGGLAFNKDGSRLVVEDEADRFHLVDTTSAKVLKKLDHVAGLVIRPGHEIVICRDLREAGKNRLRFLSLDKLDYVGDVDVPERPVAWTFEESGKRLFVLGASRRGDEKRILADEVPRELRGLARWTFRQRNDGLEATVYEIDLATSKYVGEVKTWYTSDSDTTQLARVGGRTYVFNRANLCARIEERGVTTMFETSQVVNHALGLSPDGKTLLTGAMGEGSHGPTDEGPRTAFRLEALLGQSEFFTRFAVANDGTAWAVTTAYRLVRINKAGQLGQAVPVF